MVLLVVRVTFEFRENNFQVYQGGGSVLDHVACA